MVLLFDLFAIDGTLLCRTGDLVTRGKLDMLGNEAPAARLAPLARVDVFSDLGRAFEDPRYRTVFSPPEINDEIIRTMQSVHLPETLFQEFEKMKRAMPQTYRHILRTALLSTKISLDPQIRKNFDPVIMAGSSLMHDLGKSRIPVRILNKISPLTADEHALIRSHPLTGYVLLRYYFGAGHRLVEDPSFEHHERLDGTGYPRQVHRMNRYSQVIAVADIFDAVLSRRPYRREPFTLRAALDHLLDEAQNGRLNPLYVRLLISYARKSKPTLTELRIARNKRDPEPRGNVYGKIKPS
jgi:HD-GYP domain-containing protein (c-di-GMP phosphodiesterase class II)